MHEAEVVLRDSLRYAHSEAGLRRLAPSMDFASKRWSGRPVRKISGGRFRDFLLAGERLAVAAGQPSLPGQRRLGSRATPALVTPHALRKAS